MQENLNIYKMKKKKYIFPATGSQEFEERREKRDRIRSIVRYLMSLQINIEILEERLKTKIN
jgi:predicted transcriptional regulator